MKSLKSYITESVINESKTDIVVAFDHDAPDHTYVILNAKEKDLPRTNQFDYFEASPKTNVICIRHNDESCSIVDVADNEAHMKRSALKFLSRVVDELKDKGWAEPVISMYGARFYIEAGDNWNPGDDANDLYNKLVEIIKDSKVDGDSSDVIILADLSKSNVVLSGYNDVSFHSVEEWKKIFEE